MPTVWLQGAETPNGHGRGIYETLRWSDAPPPAWPLHVARWQRGLAALGMPDVSLLDCIARAGLPPGQCWRVRVTAFADGAVEVTWRALAADELTPVPWTLRTVGQIATRPAVLRACKTTELYAAMAWRDAARALGDDEALLLGDDGGWAEATTANLIVGLADGRVATPWARSAALPGTTLAWLQTRVPIVPLYLDAGLLSQVRWAILTNAIALIRPVQAIDALPLVHPPAEILAWRKDLAIGPM